MILYAIFCEVSALSGPATSSRTADRQCPIANCGSKEKTRCRDSTCFPTACLPTDQGPFDAKTCDFFSDLIKGHGCLVCA